MERVTQRLLSLFGAAVAFGWPTGKHRSHDRGQTCRHLRNAILEERRIQGELVCQNLLRRPLEWWNAGYHPVERCAECVDIRAVTDVPSLDLLGCHVGRRS